MTRRAVLAKDRHDVVREIHRRPHADGGQKQQNSGEVAQKRGQGAKGLRREINLSGDDSFALENPVSMPGVY
jgi:hypothetical protein